MVHQRRQFAVTKRLRIPITLTILFTPAVFIYSIARQVDFDSAKWKTGTSRTRFQMKNSLMAAYKAGGHCE